MSGSGVVAGAQLGRMAGVRATVACRVMAGTLCRRYRTWYPGIRKGHLGLPSVTACHKTLTSAATRAAASVQLGGQVVWQSTDGGSEIDRRRAGRIEMRSHSAAMPKYSVGQAICSRWTAAGSAAVGNCKPFLGLCCEKLGDGCGPGRATRAIGEIHSRPDGLRLSSVDKD